MNLTIISGHLSKNPELKTVNGGRKVVNGIILNNRYYTDKDGNKKEVTTSLLFSAWGSTAERMAQYVTTKRKIMLTGTLGSDPYEKDGQMHYPNVLDVDSFEFMDSKPRDTQSASEANALEEVPVGASARGENEPPL